MSQSEIRMPSLGADMDAGTLVEWKVGVGDQVQRGSVVALVETQKATMEIESYAAGRIEALLVEPGSKVPVGAVLARLDGRAESTAAPPAPPPSAEAAPGPTPPPPAEPAVLPAPARVRSSPAARHAARELGIDLATVSPTGPHQAVVLRDVEAAARAPRVAHVRPTPSVTGQARPAPSVTGPMRDAIAAAMSRSKREIPHFYLAHTISLQRALAWLSDTNAHRPLTERLLPGVLLLKAAASALWEVPELNGFWQDGGYHPAESVHLGTAVSLRTGGVIAPALLDADQKSLDQLMAELRDLVSRARAGHLRSSEVTSPTITVTSLGEHGCEAVWPIINPPQVAIIGFGSILERPWATAGTLAVHPIVTATLAADHRVCDGHRGGLFLAAIDHLLQAPETL